MREGFVILFCGMMGRAGINVDIGGRGLMRGNCIAGSRGSWGSKGGDNCNSGEGGVLDSEEESDSDSEGDNFLDCYIH